MAFLEWLSAEGPYKILIQKTTGASQISLGGKGGRHGSPQGVVMGPAKGLSWVTSRGSGRCRLEVIIWEACAAMDLSEG